MIGYEIWLEVRIEHAYYGAEMAPVRLVLSGETKRFFERWQLIWKQQGANRWILAGEVETKALIRTENRAMAGELVFGVSPLESRFYYVSGGVRESEGVHAIAERKTPGIWKWIEIRLEWILEQRPEHVTEQKEVMIQVDTVSPYLEYIVIPSYHPTAGKIGLREAQGKLVFGGGELVVLPGIAQAYRFCSQAPIKLEREMNLQVQLWEERGAGERLISECIPFPEPDSRSVLNAENVVTTYFYY